MPQQKRHNLFTIIHQESNFIARSSKQNKNIKMLVLFIQCIFLIKSVLGLLGSGFFKYRYSAICFKTPIKLNSKLQ